MTPNESEAQSEVREVGFGKAGDRGRTLRLLNRKGSFNIERTGVSCRRYRFADPNQSNNL